MKATHDGMSDLAISTVSGMMLPSWASSNGLINSVSLCKTLRFPTPVQHEKTDVSERQSLARWAAGRPAGKGREGGDARSDGSDVV